VTQAAVALLFLSSVASLTPQQKAEVKRVEESLLAPCCYSQSIAQHMSAEAEQMRQEVVEMVAAGKSDHEILEHYKAAYGERILIVPDGSTGQVLFALPVIEFMVCSAILLFFLRRMLKARNASCCRAAGKERSIAREALRKEIERQTGDLF
jgi:cytochrome c-type biogenesis protein CcmH